jgi:hypothetical protein
MGIDPGRDFTRENARVILKNYKAIIYFILGLHKNFDILRS